MHEFHFEGRIPASKSLLNRAHIIRSYNHDIVIAGDSDADDVIYMRKSLDRIQDGREFYMGEGGTSLRFFALRASRERGVFLLNGTERLFQRPQRELYNILEQFGSDVSMLSPQTLQVRSRGWEKPKGQVLTINSQNSSQFASAVILNAWNMAFDLTLDLGETIISEPYFDMTLAMAKYAGLEFERDGNKITIPKMQKPNSVRFEMEPDMSSVASIAVMAALGGRAVFLEMPDKSVQPDERIFDFLRRMGARVERQGTSVVVEKAGRLKPIEVSLQECPDLFPVLSVACAFADGSSKLRGAPQLKHKESDRISSVEKLLTQMGIAFESRTDGLVIHGSPTVAHKEFSFDADHDHRMAMSAGILMRLGWNIHLTGKDSVNKSFPEFWSLLKVGSTLIVGHRGVGKTSFLQRITVEHKFDLDALTEQAAGQPIMDIFKNRGEDVFRQWEQKTLEQQLKKGPANQWICAGAGLRLDQIESPDRILWIRRETDDDGRVFLDRPRLEPMSDALGEFRLRAKMREPFYQRMASEVYTIPEGLKAFDEIENKILFESLNETGGSLTLLPRHRKTIPQWGANLYEFRDDILDLDEIRNLFYKLPESQVLYSVRKQKVVPDYILKSKCWLDFSLDDSYPEKELVEAHASRIILSSHGSIKDALLDFRLYLKFNVKWKMSPLISTYEELKQGHAWWLQDTQNRYFLPRSTDGRWLWYRLWMKGRSFLNFWREGVGAAPDQPTLYQWLATPRAPENFAAVLGAPVHHSWSPAEHRAFFAKYNFPFWPIEVQESEWDRALPFLQELGLRYAAVTSPLKGKALRSSKATPLAEELKSANTLVWEDSAKGWIGENTDLHGLKTASFQLPEGSVAMWGGGGTLHVLAKVFPQASAFSATSGRLRAGSPELHDSPEIVIWAAPRGEGLVWPPDHWKPSVVFDLNYKEDSPGREYALRVKAKYISGSMMFKAQAEQQQDFWQKYLER